MTESAPLAPLAGLPEEVAAVLADFCNAARDAFGDRLESLVLFGSAAERRMRATSDVNVLIVLTAFDRDRVDRLRDPARLAYAAVRLQPMFVLASELSLASEAFAVKFHDILTRRVVIAGKDPFAGLTIPRAMILHRLRQVLLNTTIRLRAVYALESLREEQLAREIAEAASPLRASASAILDLEGRPAASPRVALETIAAELGSQWKAVLEGITDAREDGRLPAGIGPSLLLQLIDLAIALRGRVDRAAA